jgi:hypothetical protein
MHTYNWFRALLRAIATPRSLPRQRRRLQCEVLEDRRTPATITVTTAADTNAVDSSVSLREAILSVNAGININADVVAAGAYGTSDAIRFAVPGAGVRSIAVAGTGLGALPALTRPVLIDGYSQAGSSPNTVSGGDNAILLVELNGAAAGAGANGLLLGNGSGGSTIRGLAINRFAGHGINVNSNGNTIAGNFIGTNAAGSAADANGGDGIRIFANSNVIGGTAPADANVIAGNRGSNIHLLGTLSALSTGNSIQGNFIGVNASGSGASGVTSSAGVRISGANNNTVGGTSPSARNVIGFNVEGIVLNNGAQNNIIQGNAIGSAANGTSAIGNTRHGVVLHSSGNLPAPDGPGQPNEPGVRIGGTSAGAGNVIAHNGFAGVAVFGNPVALSGQANTGNAILGNSILNNGRSSAFTIPGIDLSLQSSYPGDDGLTANDSVGHGAPSNPNNSQNAPVLTAVTAASGSTTIAGRLTQSATPNATFRIELYTSASAGGIAQGQTFLGFTTVTTDAAGQASFVFTTPTVLAAGQVVTATATDGANNTSEFARGFTVPGVLPGNPTSLRFRLTRTTSGIRLLVLDGSTGRQLWSIIPFARFFGRIRAVARDMNLDGFLDVVVAQGPGGRGLVSILDGRRRRQVALFVPFGVGRNGVSSLGVSDVNADGTPDVAVSFTLSPLRLRMTYDGASLFARIRRVLDTRFLGSA